MSSSNKIDENEVVETATGNKFMPNLLFQLKNGIAKEHLKKLSKQTANNSIVSLIIIAITTFSLLPYAPLPLLLTWSLLHTSIFLIILFRWYGAKGKKKKSKKHDISLSKKGLYHAIFWAIISGGFWGALTVFIPTSPPYITFGLILLMGGMSAGASTTLGSITLVSSSFILATNLPAILYFAFLDHDESIWLSTALATFTVAMLITTRIVNKSFTQQLSAEIKTEQYRIDSFQNKIISIINEELNSDKALEMCLNEICKKLEWPLGHVYWINEGNKSKFIPSNIWHTDNVNLFKPFVRVTENTILDNNQGFLGRVLVRRTPIWVEDISNEINFVRKDIAKATNIKSVFAFPIFINQKPVAILEFFNTDISPADPEIIAQAIPIGIQIGRAIERHENNRSLAESESRFRALIKNSGQGIVVHDNGKPIFANEEVERIFGYSQSQFLKLSSIYSLVDSNDEGKILEHNEEITRHPEEQFSLEYNAVNSFGTIVPVLIRSSVISWLGKDAILSTIVDLTNIKKTEMKLQQKQKMEAVGKLTGGIAHDFNNILMAISGNLELINTKVQDDKELKHWTEIAMHGADRGSDLTKQLLLFSQQREMSKHNISISNAIQELSLLTSNTLPSNIVFNNNIPSDLPMIKVDPSEFDSAIINLIVNSRDAMPKGGRIDVSAKELTVTDTLPYANEIEAGNYVALKISDTGCGIQNDIIENIFDPFFSSKDHGKGFGLGLSSVLGFVKASGGTITLDSKIDEGTTFTLYFPVSVDKNSEHKNKKTKHNINTKANGELILVVEDDPSIRSVVMDFLKIKGYKTIGAVDGDSALKILKKHKDIELVLSDIMMPGKTSGIELVKKYLKNNPDGNAILMTGYSGDQALGSTGAPENVTVLRKPFHKEKLFEAINACLSNKQLESI